jgi:hypothetical protein
VWTPAKEWRVRANAQQAFRVPTLNELYRPFRQGTTVVETNPDLRTERVPGSRLARELLPNVPESGAECGLDPAHRLVEARRDPLRLAAGLRDGGRGVPQAGFGGVERPAECLEDRRVEDRLVPGHDPEDAEDLPAHRALLGSGVALLEDLDLAGVPEGEYQLVALPLRFQDLDASPVRAILIEE